MAPHAASLFHGFTAVAELKPSAPTLQQSKSDGFHGFTAVAELKRRAAVRSAVPCDCCFHGFTAVAELKLRKHDKLSWVEQSFPRLHRRGRIEAALAYLPRLWA